MTLLLSFISGSDFSPTMLSGGANLSEEKAGFSDLLGKIRASVGEPVIATPQKTRPQGLTTLVANEVDLALPNTLGSSLLSAAGHSQSEAEMLAQGIRRPQSNAEEAVLKAKSAAVQAGTSGHDRASVSINGQPRPVAASVDPAHGTTNAVPSASASGGTDQSPDRVRGLPAMSPEAEIATAPSKAARAVRLSERSANSSGLTTGEKPPVALTSETGPAVAQSTQLEVDPPAAPVQASIPTEAEAKGLPKQTSDEIVRAGLRHPRPMPRTIDTNLAPGGIKPMPEALQIPIPGDAAGPADPELTVAGNLPAREKASMDAGGANPMASSLEPQLVSAVPLQPSNAAALETPKASRADGELTHRTEREPGLRLSKLPDQPIEAQAREAKVDPARAFQQPAAEPGKPDFSQRLSQAAHSQATIPTGEPVIASSQSTAPQTEAARAPAQTMAPDAQVAARAGHMGKDIAVHIARHSNDGQDALTIRLDPAELGRIHIRMQFDEQGSLRAHITAESNVALDMLRRESFDLARALNDAGVRNDAQSFRFDSRGQEGGQQGQRQHSQNHHADHFGSEGEALPEDLEYRQVRSNGAVDLFA